MVDKYELIRSTAENLGLPKITCEAVINEFIDEIRRNLIQWNDISLVKLMTIKITNRASRQGYDLQTGKYVCFPPTKIVKVKLAQPLVKAIKSRKVIDEN